MALPGVLWALAVALPVARGAVPHPVCAAEWMLGVSAPLFAGLLGVALVVHVLVQHKTVAHLLLIAAWVGAIALGARGLAGAWDAYGVCDAPAAYTR
jgi:hypothetical protein